MELGLTFMIIAVTVIGIWVIVELKRLKHKLFAIFLIMAILFFYLTISYTFKEQEINFKTTEGIIKGAKIYGTWLASSFGNVKTITTNAVKMDWSATNSSVGE